MAAPSISPAPAVVSPIATTPTATRDTLARATPRRLARWTQQPTAIAVASKCNQMRFRSSTVVTPAPGGACGPTLSS